ncbi:MAG: sodium:proton antiporter [Rhodocyclales bacterium]|mgnify:CR=1 FL=1|nr:sodium:proton antiporter [Rhodocyclales bacterium]
MKRLAVSLGAALFAALLGAALLELGPPAATLAPLVAGTLAQSGVTHPVTAVLLNFRGYDTLLEIAVLLIALIGLTAVARRGEAPAATAAVEPVLTTLARLAAPLMVLVAVYLLWAGAHRPGGAFQAGAVLAAAAVLLHLTRLLPAWAAPGAWLRAGLAGGFLLFLAIAAALLAEGALLKYPPAQAGLLILAIESGLTVSLGLILAGLFLFLSEEANR